MSSSEFYDNFISYQINSGINDRVYSLFKRLCKTGISSGTSILEIGCGIGTLTYLLSRKIRKGKIVAMDISPKSIDYAKTHLTQSNLDFYTSDILEFEPEISNFQRILLFDVIEHIPEENHFDLFDKIFHWMNDRSLLLINLPNPNYILFDQKNNPEKLQETDQPIFLDRLASVLARASLDIEYLKTYSIWVRNDYHFLVVKKRTEFIERTVSSERTLMERLRIRLTRDYRKLIYQYPVKEINKTD